MELHFYKYQGTGNDFILIDDRDKNLILSETQVKFLCDRHFGIGADGLMLLQNSESVDFNMVYYNSDGRESSMCGNGGRCITAFAKKLGLVSDQASFNAIDGLHHASINQHGIVSLHMQDVDKITNFETFTELNTGSPHYVHFMDDVASVAMDKEGALIRYSPKYKEEGINVNFVEVLSENSLFVRTYERGVEDETLSCGTGVTAAAIAYKQKKQGNQDVQIKTLGGDLQVSFNIINEQCIQDVYLIGPAQFVYEGTILL